MLANPDIRLLTILAPGGMGKTRLALEAARMQIGIYAHGVFFVPLAPLSTHADVIPTIGETIGFVFYGEDSPTQQLIDFLRNRAMLLVLDNFEHLLDSASFVADMVRVAPGLRVLITSRERLNLSGETVYTLRGLDFPDWQTPEPIRSYHSVRLFVQSAQRIHPGFELKADGVPYVARICHLTGGMPLAIELAAGWLDTLSLERIADEIQQGIDILETNLRDVPERHRSVRATFEITWQRLTDDVQAIFGRLSVFRGGFTLQAAQAVAGADAHQLRDMAQKALIQAEGSERFIIHELLRQFGVGKLAETGELPTVQAHYAAYFAEFMQERRGEIFTGQQLDALDQIGADYENIRAAWNLLVERQAFEELPKFLDGLWCFLHSRNQEGIELFETTANTVQSFPPSDTTELTLARLRARLAWFYRTGGLSEKSEAAAEAAIRLFDYHDSPEDRLIAYQGLGVTYMFRWDGENTRRIAETGLELARELGNRYWEAHSLILLSPAARMCGDGMDAVLRPLRQARAIYESLGNPWGMVLSYATEAGSAFEAGDYEQVKRWSEQCLALAKAFGNASHIGTSAMYLGIVALWQGEDGLAWNWLRQALRTFWNAGLAHYAPGPMVGMVTLLLHESQVERAIETLALADRYPGYHAHGAPLEIGPYRVKQLRADLEARLEPMRFAAAWERGRNRELSTVVTELLSADFDRAAPDM